MSPITKLPALAWASQVDPKIVTEKPCATGTEDVRPVSLRPHGDYNFKPGLWLVGDATCYRGGETGIDTSPSTTCKRARAMGRADSVTSAA